MTAVAGLAFRADGNFDVSTPEKRAAACETCLHHILVTHHVHAGQGDAFVLAEILRMVNNVVDLLRSQDSGCAMTTAWRPCAFSFDGTPTWDGFTDDTRWNGFLNVEVTPEVHALVIAYFEDDEEDPDAAEEFKKLQPNKRGRYSYAGGFATAEAYPDED